MERLAAAATRPDAFHRLVLTSRAAPEGWTRLVATPVALRDGTAVKVVRTVGTREETETVRGDDWPERLAALLAGPFDAAHVQSPAGDVHARRTRKGRLLVSGGRPSRPEAVAAAPHDRVRGRALDLDDPEVVRLLQATGLAGDSGRLRADGRDKERQLQHYLELLRPLDVLRGGGPLAILDAGCGKASLSLALVLYARRLGHEPVLTGLDANPEVVATVRTIADDLGLPATFEATTIAAYTAAHGEAHVDLLVSLHACDTATDEALAAGVRLGARAIVLAPCCHRELAGALDEDRMAAGIARHGLLRSRTCDIATDALRAALLEVHGYRADVIEFVAAEHTARNVMIRAERRPHPDPRAEAAARDAYAELRALWRTPPAAERLLGAP